MSALRNLLSQIIDYAGLFPPAGLPLSQVVRNYATYMEGQHRWMLARLIIPAGRLAEFGDTYQNLIAAPATAEVWKISALIPAVDAEQQGFAQALESIQQFHDQFSFALVDTVEGKLPAPELVEETCRRLPPSLTAFLEIPFHDPDAALQALAANDRQQTFAKIRTGGVTADLIPSTEQVAHFIHQAVGTGLGFKATAGLHHPLRGEFPLTYESDAPRSVMHGFWNVFLAAALAQHRNWSVPQLAGLLDNRTPQDWKISNDSIDVAGEVVTAAEIENTRRDLACSFGSCSFVEPIEDLSRLGWLADAAKTV